MNYDSLLMSVHNRMAASLDECGRRNSRMELTWWRQVEENSVKELGQRNVLGATISRSS